MRRSTLPIVGEWGETKRILWRTKHGAVYTIGEERSQREQRVASNDSIIAC